MSKLTSQDITHLREEYLAMLLVAERMAEGGPDVVMTSIGYVNLWTDGTVELFGQFDEDGDWTPNEDGDDAAEGEECEAQAAALGNVFSFDEVDGDYYLVLPFVCDDWEGEE